LVLRFDLVRSCLLFEHFLDKFLFVKVLEVLGAHKVFQLVGFIERKQFLSPLEVFDLCLFDVFRSMLLLLLSLL